MKIFFWGLVFGFLNLTGQAVATSALYEHDALKQKGPELDVSVVADKHTYKPSDRIKLEVLLVNNDAVKDIFVYGTLQFGYRASFTLFRRDAKGNDVPIRFIDDAWELPPKPNEVSAFVKLLPFHFLGTTYKSSIHLLNLERPGKYTIWVEYHCPISTAGVALSPFWGKESGTIKSNVIEIEVVQ
jgi:hypothetical protein